MTPDPSTIDVVRSCEIKISLEPKSPSGPPVCNLVTSGCSKPSFAKVPFAYSCTDKVVIPYLCNKNSEEEEEEEKEEEEEEEERKEKKRKTQECQKKNTPRIFIMITIVRYKINKILTYRVEYHPMLVVYQL